MHLFEATIRYRCLSGVGDQKFEVVKNDYATTNGSKGNMSYYSSQYELKSSAARHPNGSYAA
jgi:hypothetical protein